MSDDVEYQATSTLSFEDAKALLDELPLADAGGVMSQLWERGQIDGVLSKLVRYMASRIAFERLFDFVLED